MSVTAVVTNYVKYSGDQENDQVFASGDLENSPAVQSLVTLAAGNNSISVPDVDDFVTHGLVIVPPSLNDEEITIKGIGADTGISLSASEASCIQFGTPPASIVLSVTNEVVGVKLIWF